MFNRGLELRNGFGLAYSTDAHYMLASHWGNDQANDASFVFHDHAHYMYGFWKEDLPHGFNAVRMGSTLTMGFYDRGALASNILVLFEQYNLAVILKPHPTSEGS